MSDNNLKNGKTTFNWIKNRVEFIITIITIIIAFSVAWTQLKAQVDNNREDISDNRVKYENLIDELKDINSLLNDKDIGLAAIHNRLKNIEK